MHYNGRTFLSTLTFAALQPSSLAGWIPSRQPEDVQQHDGGSAQVTLPDLGDLAKYVCPNTDISGRQTSGLSPVSSAQVHEILEMLKAYERSTLAVVSGIAVADRLNSARAAPPDLIAPSPIPSIQPVGNAGFVVSNRPKPELSTSISTLTISVTSIITATPDPVTTTVTISNNALPVPGTTTDQGIPDLLTAAPTDQQQAAATTALPAITPIPSAAVAYKFNATSQSNVAVYFGQTSATGATTLEAQCADPNTDIVVLSFVIQQLDGGPYPQLNFGPACGGQTPLMAQQAPGLLYCPELASNITACQRGWGKKVMLSVGGDSSLIKFSSDKAAKDFAGVLWNLFGPSGNVDPELRPFGMVEVDGFDIDNEGNFPQHWPYLAMSFRALFRTAMKPYYLSSAPQCLFPFSDPLPMLLQCDFVWVQFYNSPACEIGAPGFNTSIISWTKNLNASTLSPKPRLYIGAPAWTAASPMAYKGIIGGPQGMKKVVSGVRELMAQNGVGGWLGGVMFWDGPEGHLNAQSGKDIIGWAKDGLTA